MSNEMCKKLNCKKCENIKMSIHPCWHGEGTKMYNIPDGATKLILGSMPPRKLCINKETGKRFEENDRDVFYFYGSDKNCFWQILPILEKIKKENLEMEYTDILDWILNPSKKEYEKLKDAEARKKFLETRNIGIGDIYKCCEHGEEGYLDKNIKNAVFQDDLFEELENSNSSIKEIFCTSKYVVEKFLEHIEKKFDEKIKETIKPISDDGRSIEIEINNKPIPIYILYSPVRRVVGRFKKDNEKAKKYLKNYINIFEASKN